MLLAEDIIGYIDPTLTLLENYSHSERGVFKVEKEGKPYILKSFICDQCCDEEGIKSERAALLALKDLEGIGHIVTDYGVMEGFPASYPTDTKRISILKEYVAGTVLAKHEGYLSNTKLKDCLRQTLSEIQRHGFTNIDIDRVNFVIGPNEEYIKFIDLGGCKSRTEISAKEWDKWKEWDQDLMNDLIESLYKN